MFAYREKGFTVQKEGLQYRRRRKIQYSTRDLLQEEGLTTQGQGFTEGLLYSTYTTVQKGKTIC